MRYPHIAGLCVLLAFGAAAWQPVKAQVSLNSPPQIPSGTASKPDCPASSNLVPLALRNTRVVTFGETHGTEEVPRLVGDYVCALAHQEPRRPVVLALEFDAGEQALADAYLASPGEPADVARLLMGALWQGVPAGGGKRIHDGRTSRAGLGLFERMRQLRATGYSVSIVLLTPVHDKNPELPGDQDQAERNYEQGMAGTLLKALAINPDAQFVVEGGGHMASRHDVLNRPNYQPMGEILRRAGMDVISLVAINGPGSYAWDCQLPEDYKGPPTLENVSCGPWPVPATAPRTTPVIRLDAYDGTFYVGTTHASPPAVAAVK